MADTSWPLRSYLELGALPSAVPCARLHARLLAAEWGFEALAQTVELVVSELVTNAIRASEGVDGQPVQRTMGARSATSASVAAI